MSGAWVRPIRLAELARGPVELNLAPDAATRAALARELNLESLPALTGKLTVYAWLDGAEIVGRLDGVAEYICGISLEPFEQPLEAEVEIRIVPAGSENAPAEALEGEVELDADLPDPPDVLEGEEIDMANYVLEQLALAVDPFPRKPGAVFDYQPPEADLSPFSVLKSLKDKKD